MINNAILEHTHIYTVTPLLQWHNAIQFSEYLEILFTIKFQLHTIINNKVMLFPITDNKKISVDKPYFTQFRLHHRKAVMYEIIKESSK